MKIGIDQAKNIKYAISVMFADDSNFEDLMEFLEDMAGKWAPNYDPDSSTSIILAAGRAEFMQTLRNLNRLTEDQILEKLEEGQ